MPSTRTLDKSIQRRGVIVNAKHADVGRAPGKVIDESDVLTPDVGQTIRAGAISYRYAIWQTLTSDTFILHTIAGVRLEFEGAPRQTGSPRQLNLSDYEFYNIDRQVNDDVQQPTRVAY